jgi:succinate dehydrogenase/fumarate reductase cytochrome b subunit
MIPGLVLIPVAVSFAIGYGFARNKWIGVIGFIFIPILFSVAVGILLCAQNYGYGFISFMKAAFSPYGYLSTSSFAWISYLFGVAGYFSVNNRKALRDRK